MSTIAYAEARAALARKWRQGDLDDEEHQKAVASLGGDWPTFSRLDVTDPLAIRAGQLAQSFALRSFDAVHLASALTFAERIENLHFLALDIRLINAARAASLPVYGDSPNTTRDEDR